MENAEVIVPVYQLLQVVGRTGIVLEPSRTEGLDVIDDGVDLLIITIGDDVMNGVEVPLVDYMTTVLPRYCRYVLEPDSTDEPH